jgi:programmed cell death 6-interacting protein
VKQLHFEAAAQYRLSQEDLEKSRYGEEIARLKVAEACAKKGLDTGKRGVADAVIADLRVCSTSTSVASVWRRIR